MIQKKKILIIGKNHELNILTEKMFNRGGFETIICRDEDEAHNVYLSEEDTIGSVFYPRKHKKEDMKIKLEKLKLSFVKN